MATDVSARDLLAVSTLGLGVFTATTTEIMPIGLLQPMADDLGVTDSLVGLTVTFFAVVAAIASPTLASATRAVDRRRVMIGVMVVFAVGNAVTAVTSSYAMLVAVRAVVGCALGLMWAIVAATAVLLVPSSASVRATAIALSGVSIASVAGMPLGTFVGQLWGWRSAFWGLAALAALAAVVLVVVMRPTQPLGGVTLRELPRTLRIADLRITLGVTSLVVIGSYAAYTYVTPFIIESIGVADRLVSVILLAMGVFGVVGNFASGWFVGQVRAMRWSLAVLVGLLTVALFAVLLTAGFRPVAIAMLMLWSAAYAAIPVGLQTGVFRAAPREREPATTLYATTFNLSIAVGALVGAVAIGRGGPSTPIAVGAVVCAAAFLLTFGLPAGSSREQRGAEAHHLLRDRE